LSLSKRSVDPAHRGRPLIAGGKIGVFVQAIFRLGERLCPCTAPPLRLQSDCSWISEARDFRVAAMNCNDFPVDKAGVPSSFSDTALFH